MGRKQLSGRSADRPADPSTSAPDVDDAACTVLHVDMDAFFASVELLDRPELRGRPVIVGGGPRGVVLSATYEARRAGVHSAMPMSRARRICPQAVVLPSHHEKYRAVSLGVMQIFRDITPAVEPLSVDEAFLDISGSVRRLGPPLRIGALIRAQVAAAHGITCSVGAASTKFVAKLASTQSKPDGLLAVPPDEVIAFLHPLPIGALWGVGERTEATLTRLGLRTVGDLAHAPVGALTSALGKAVGTHLFELAWGRDERVVTPGEGERSIGAEHTFDADIDDPDVARRELLRLSERVAARARAAGRLGRTVSVKIRFADFTTVTRAKTLGEPTDVAHEIYAAATALHDGLGLDRARLRLVGVRLEGLVDVDQYTHQLVLDAPESGWREAEHAVDRATARFGPDAIRKARLVDPGQPDGRERLGRTGDAST